MEIRKLNCKVVDYPVFASINGVEECQDFIYKVCKELQRNVKHTQEITLFSYGVSGALLSSALFQELYHCFDKVKIRVIRKSNEQSHHLESLDKVSGIKVVIDDFIDTGDSIYDILKKAGEIDYLFVSNNYDEMQDSITSITKLNMEENIKIAYFGS